MCISLLYCVKKKKRVRVYIDRRGDHTWLGKKIISSSSSSSGLLLTFDDIVRIVQYTLVDPKNGALFFLYLSVRMGFSKNAKPNSPREVCALLSPLNKRRRRRRKVRIPAYIFNSLSVMVVSGEITTSHGNPHNTQQQSFFPFSCSFLSFFFCVPDFFFFFLVLFCVWNPCELLANKDLQ